MSKIEAVNITYRDFDGNIRSCIAIRRKTGYEIVAKGGGRTIIPFDRITPPGNVRVIDPKQQKR